MTTKTTTTTTTDPDDVRAEARRLAAEAAAAQAKVEASEADTRARLAEHQAALDRRVIAGYRAADHDDAVDQAYTELMSVVAELPLTKALTKFLAAQSLRQHAHAENLGARARLGMRTAGAQQPPTTDALPVGEYINRVAEQLAHEVLEQAIDTAHHNRTTHPEESR